jgi:SSS family solute:Na+ symporter
MSRERRWVTPGDMLSDLYGSRLPAVVAGIVYLVSLIPYASVQLRGIGEAFSGLGGSQDLYGVGIVFGSAVMIVWIMIAGIWSIAVTDAIQGAWMLASALMLLLWLLSTAYSSGLGLGEALDYMGAEAFKGPGSFWTLPVFLAFTVPWIFFAVTNPQVLQRLFMPRDRRILASMIKLYALFGITYTVLVTLIGITARALNESGVLALGGELRNDEVTPAILSVANPLLASIVFTSIIAASVSTADSIILTLSSTTSRDVVRPASERRRLAVGYATSAGILLAMAALAWTRAGFIVLLSVLSSLMLLSLAPPIIASWAGARPHPLAASASMVVGPLTVIALAWANDWNPVETFLARPLGIPVSIIILSASTLLTLIGYYAGKRG